MRIALFFMTIFLGMIIDYLVTRFGIVDGFSSSGQIKIYCFLVCSVVGGSLFLDYIKKKK